MTNTNEARRLADELAADVAALLREGLPQAAMRADKAQSAMRELADENERMRAQVEALRADAERYRWLRHRKAVTAPHADIARHAAERFDAAIDASRSQEAAG